MRWSGLLSTRGERELCGFLENIIPDPMSRAYKPEESKGGLEAGLSELGGWLVVT